MNFNEWTTGKNQKNKVKRVIHIKFENNIPFNV